MDDWGEIKLEKIDFASDFWSLYDELAADESRFICNREHIVDAYKNNILYSLRVDETQKMYDNSAHTDAIFSKNSLYLLPCFCIAKNNNISIIWTHTRARKMGFAKKLVKLLNIKQVENILPESREFWEKCDIMIV